MAVYVATPINKPILNNSQNKISNISLSALLENQIEGLIGFKVEKHVSQSTEAYFAPA